VNETALSATLFALLDAAVLADRGAAGFEGKVAVGVLGTKELSWWVGELRADQKTALTSRSAKTPENCAAMVVLGEDETKRILEGRPFPRYPRVFRAFGDNSVIEKFRRRYLERKNLLGLRAAREGGRS
jgi:hypothetical protein